MIPQAQVLIFQPSISTLQAGLFKAGLWYMKFINYQELNQKYIFDLMNWIGGYDTLKSVVIPFENQKEAINYAKEKNFLFQIEKSEQRKLKPKSYTDNFL